MLRSLTTITVFVALAFLYLPHVHAEKPPVPTPINLQKEILRMVAGTKNRDLNTNDVRRYATLLEKSVSDPQTACLQRNYTYYTLDNFGKKILPTAKKNIALIYRCWPRGTTQTTQLSEEHQTAIMLIQKNFFLEPQEKYDAQGQITAIRLGKKWVQPKRNPATHTPRALAQPTPQTNQSSPSPSSGSFWSTIAIPFKLFYTMGCASAGVPLAIATHLKFKAVQDICTWVW